MKNTNFLQSFFKLNKNITLIIMVLINLTFAQLMTLTDQYPNQNYNDTYGKLLEVDGNFNFSNQATRKNTYFLNEKEQKFLIFVNFSDYRFNNSTLNFVYLNNRIYLKIENKSFECIEINSEKENILNGLINGTTRSDIENLYYCTEILLDKINLTEKILFLTSDLESNINNENSFSSIMENQEKVKGSYLISKLKTDFYVKSDLEISGPEANNFYFQSINNTSLESNALDRTQFFSKYNINKYPLENNTNYSNDRFLNLILINQAQYLKVFSKIVFVVMVIFLFN